MLERELQLVRLRRRCPPGPTPTSYFRCGSRKWTRPSPSRRGSTSSAAIPIAAACWCAARARPVRGGRGGGRGGGSYYGNKENGTSDHNNAEKSADEDEVRNDVEEFDRGQAEGGESDDAGAGKAGEADCGSLSEEPSKNAISEQVFG